jgi:hypothetical protein
MRKHTLGDPDHVPLADARKGSQQLLAKVKLGGDPAGEHKAVKATITVGQMVEQYLAYRRARMKPRTHSNSDRGLRVRRMFLPAGAVPADHGTGTRSLPPA